MQKKKIRFRLFLLYILLHNCVYLFPYNFFSTSIFYFPIILNYDDNFRKILNFLQFDMSHRE